MVQDKDMKDDKPLDAWKPASKNFNVNGKYYILRILILIELI